MIRQQTILVTAIVAFATWTAIAAEQKRALVPASGKARSLGLNTRVTLKSSADTTLSDIAFDIEAQTGVPVDLSAALVRAPTTAQVALRTAHDTLRAIAALYRCNLRITNERGREHVYLWHSPDGLRESKLMRKGEADHFEHPLLQAFDMVLHPPNDEIAAEIDKYYRYTYGAAVLLNMFDSQRRSAIISDGLEPIPFRRLPQAVQEGLKEGFARSATDWDPHAIPPRQPQAIPVDKWIPFVKFGFSNMIDPSGRRVFCISKHRIKEGEDGYPDDLQPPRALPLGELGVGWTKWTHGYDEAPANATRAERARLPGSAAIESMASDRPLNDAANAMVANLQPRPLILNGQAMSLLLQSGQALGMDVVIGRATQHSRFPRAHRTSKQPRDVGELLEQVGNCTGYAFGCSHGLLLWRHAAWFGSLEPTSKAASRSNNGDAVTLAESLIGKWNERKKANKGVLPLDDLSHMASASDDQLDSLKLSALPEARAIRQPTVRALLILFDTLTREERARALGKAGVPFRSLDSHQLALLSGRATSLGEIGKRIAQSRNTTTLWVCDYPKTDGRRKLLFKFGCDGRQSTPVWLNF